MKQKVLVILEKALAGGHAELAVPEQEEFGHFSTNAAMRLAKERKKKPLELAEELAQKIKEHAPEGFFDKVEAIAPGFVNFWVNEKEWQTWFGEVASAARFGTNEGLKGQTVMVEFTDPNPFKLFHIGHLMSNTIGESFSRLNEAAGAKVVRANYESDVGLHIGKAIWGMKALEAAMPGEEADLRAKMEFLGKAYASGAKAYESEEDAKREIEGLNQRIYSREDGAVNALYDKGRRWSLDYFETIYRRLGTKFDEYYFESEIGKAGLEVIAKHKDIFETSEGAVVFRGEKYGLHTRVFVNAKGLPTYEAKELGLNRTKFEKHKLDLSIIVTGSEIVEYFKVLLKAMELALPDVAARTRHVPHGMLRLPSGKMSSRTGDVITAEGLLDELKAKVREHTSERSELSPEEREAATEIIAVGAIKYSILKQNPGQDIVFDFEKSLSVTGDSGPYVQYAYARLASILRKAGGHDDAGKGDLSSLRTETEVALIRRLAEFPDVVAHARERFAPSALVAYVYRLAAASNRFYETTPVLKDDNASRREARLALVRTAARALAKGLDLLGMKTLERL